MVKNISPTKYSFVFFFPGLDGLALAYHPSTKRARDGQLINMIKLGLKQPQYIPPPVLINGSWKVASNGATREEHEPLMQIINK